MYIKRLTIYGFGQWVDHTLTLKEPLTLFYGKNESGKSTLRHFILFMLFGFPPKKRKFYMPKNSGKLGGRLTIVDESIGEFTIERIEGQQQAKATCYLPNGIMKDETWLKERLKGVNLAVYESIYSFSATDLVGLEQMDAKELGDVILSIGLSGSKRIYTLEKQLNDRLGELFKRYGKKPTINQHVEKLTNLQKQLAAQEKILTTYKKNQRTLESLSREIESLLQKRDQLQREKDHLTTLHRATSLIQDYKYNEAQLNTLPKDITFPQQGIERLEALKEQLIPLESEQSIIHEQIDQSKIVINDLKGKCTTDDTLQRAKRIVKKQSIYEERNYQRRQEDKAINQALEMIQTKLTKLNVNMTLDDLSTLNFPFQTQNHWQALHHEYEQIKLAKEHLDKQKQELNQREQILMDRLQSIEAQRLTEEKRQQILEHLDALTEKPIRQKQLATVQQQIKREQRQRQIYFISSFSIALIIFFIGYMMSEPMFMVISLLPLILGGILTIYLKKSTDSFQQTLRTHEHQSLSKYQQRYNHLIAQIEADDHLQYEHTALKDELRQLNIEQLQLSEKIRATEKRQMRLNNQLQHIKEAYPFLNDIQLPYWIELYHELTQLKQQYNQLLERKDKFEDLKQSQEQFVQSVQQFIAKIAPQKLDQSIKDQLDEINQWIDEQTEINQQLLYEREHLQKLFAKRKRIDTQVKTLHNKMTELFKKADVQSEESFYERATLIEQKQTYETAIEKLDQQLTLIFQTDDWHSRIDHPLEEQLLTEAISDIEEDYLATNQLLDKKRQTIANIQAENLHFEQSNQYSMYVHERNRIANELNRLAKRWAIIKTAEQMLQQVMEKYQQKHLREVLVQTSLYFQRMTKGAYTNVFLTEDERVLTVQTKTKQYFNVAHLSKGTLDQLYIALRLAISQIVGKKYKLPFIIDDAFIHSDDERATKILSILRDIAKEQQLILFTCHRHIATNFYEHETIELEQKHEVF